MNNPIQIRFGENQYTLDLTIGVLRNIERELNVSLVTTLNLMNAEGISRKLNIDFIMATLRFGLDKTAPKTDEGLYDLIDDYCNAGSNLDMLMGVLVGAYYMNTNFFTPRAVSKEELNKAK